MVCVRVSGMCAGLRSAHLALSVCAGGRGPHEHGVAHGRTGGLMLAEREEQLGARVQVHVRLCL